MIKLGYKASAEQFAPGALLGFSCLAEEVGFEDPTALTFDVLMICSPNHRFVEEARNAARPGSPTSAR